MLSEYVAQFGAIRRGMHEPIVKAVQEALVHAGASLVADDTFGPITEVAVKRYQAAHKLVTLGIVGPKTAALLDQEVPTAAPPLASVKTVAPWLSVMRALTGTKEVPGTKDSPIILEWKNEIISEYPDLRTGIMPYTHDSIPWCGYGMAYSVVKGGCKPPLFPLYALNWSSQWPESVRLKEPTRGAIMVLERSGGGHVTIYEGEDDNYWFGRGCNQSDMVNVAKFPHSRKPVGIMWPKAAPYPSTGRVRVSFDAAVSLKEA